MNFQILRKTVGGPTKTTCALYGHFDTSSITLQEFRKTATVLSFNDFDKRQHSATHSTKKSQNFVSQCDFSVNFSACEVW